MIKLSQQLTLWNQATIKLLDIRYITLKLGEEVRSYRLPASGFLYAVRGSACLQLDGTQHQANRTYLLHGGKGCYLDIMPGEQGFDYYLIYYKAVLTLPARKELLAMMERMNPFLIQYGFVPEYPASLLHKVQLIQQEWERQGLLERLHAKAQFYQFVHELLWQMQNQHVPVMQADLVTQAMRYMNEHFAEPLTMDELAMLMDTSQRHLSRLFKMQTGSSTIDYLIQIRMSKAKELLLNTDMSLQEIADGIGYPDRYYFAKMFKRYTGIPPISYRVQYRDGQQCPNVPSLEARYDIVSKRSKPYSVNEFNNHYQYKGERKKVMYTYTKSSVAVTLLLCLTLLLSACSSGTNAGTGAQAGNERTDTNQTVVASETPQTKKVSTVKGEVEIPVNPQRVVVLYLLGDALALNVKPVGISDVYDGAAFKDELAGIQSLGEWFTPSREAVLELDPDLIIVPSEETYQLLKPIAPTVLIPYENMSLEERLKQIGGVLGKEGDAQKLLDGFHTKVEQAKQKLKDAGIIDKTVTIVEGGKGSMSVIMSKHFGRGSQIIYDYLGMKAPKVVQHEIDTTIEASGKDVSYEVLSEYVGDYVFRVSYDGMEDLSDNTIWNNLPAVKEGRLIEIDFGLSYYNDIYSLDKQLDFIVERLLATVK